MMREIFRRRQYIDSPHIDLIRNKELGLFFLKHLEN